jgi:siroheme synthase-like protein
MAGAGEGTGTGTGTGTGDYYPVSLDVTGRRCLVVGGGRVALRKVQALVSCGAVVTVVAPSICAELDSLAASGTSGVAVERRPYSPGDVAGFRLVISATGDPLVDGAVYAEADAAGVWVNSADDPDHCTFIVPSVHRDGRITIAVSSGGASPALSRWVRQQIAAGLGQGLDELAALLVEARRKVQGKGISTERVDWAALLDGPLPELVRSGDLEGARALIDDALARVQ